MRSACEDSLRRLGTDDIDLYQLHYPDDTVADRRDARRAARAGRRRARSARSAVRTSPSPSCARRRRRPATDRASSRCRTSTRCSSASPRRDGVLEACDDARTSDSCPSTPWPTDCSPARSARASRSPRDSRLAMMARRTQRALAGRRLAGQGRRTPRLRRRDRGSDPVTSPSRGCSATAAVSSVIAGASNADQVRANAARRARTAARDVDRATCDELTS